MFDYMFNPYVILLKFYYDKELYIYGFIVI